MALSRRDRLNVAWHEVPGKASLEEPSRRVRYDSCAADPTMHQGIISIFLVIPHSKFPPLQSRIGAHPCANHTVPYGTVLPCDAFPGTSCQATIALSLRHISLCGAYAYLAFLNATFSARPLIEVASQRKPWASRHFVPGTQAGTACLRT